MTRTIINLDPDDKAWLDREARDRRVPMTEVVREAIRSYRQAKSSRRRPSLAMALERTSGIWRHGDGLDWQERSRSEWDRDA